MNRSVHSYMRRCTIGVPIGLVLVYAVSYGIARLVALPTSFAILMTCATGAISIVAVLVGIAIRIKTTNATDQHGESFRSEFGKRRYSRRLVVVLGTIGALTLISLSLVAFSNGLQEAGVVLIGAVILLLLAIVSIFGRDRRRS